MRVIVKDFGNNKEYEIEVEDETNVDVLKLKLSSKYNINYNLLILKQNGNELKNPNAKMKDLGITDGTTLELFIYQQSKK